jgi:opacity protein-like surface antigen
LVLIFRHFFQTTHLFSTMKNNCLTYALFGLALAAVLLSQSHCVVAYESARMLPKGGAEVKTALTHVRERYEGEGDKLNNGFGLGLGYGVTDRVNLKVRYERISVEGSLNYFAFGPKIALKPNKVALLVPFGAYFEDGESEWGMHPAVLFTNSKNNKVETTLGLRADVFFEEDADLLLGLNLGFGLSQDLNRWAIRPDIGLTFNPGEKGFFWTLGAGAEYRFSTNGK